MRSTQLLLLGALLAGLAQPAHADDCDNATSQAAINQCAIKNYQREDALLNNNYKALLAKTDQGRQAALTAAQRAWIKFRDLHCKFVAGQAQGGSIYAAIYNGCLTEMTQARNKELKALMGAE